MLRRAFLKALIVALNEFPGHRCADVTNPLVFSNHSIPGGRYYCGGGPAGPAALPQAGIPARCAGGKPGDHAR